MKRHATLCSLLTLTFVGSCAGEAPITANAGTEAEFSNAAKVPDPSTAIEEARSALSATRPATWKGTKTIYEGTWGTWRQTIYCNNGQYAIGFSQRVEANQGGGDDTALNSVRLSCRRKDSAVFDDNVSSYDGLWGNWSSASRCPVGGSFGQNNFVKGARLKVEDNQGNGDDTAANAAQMRCVNGGEIYASNDGIWGEWKDWADCDEGTVVCGISIQFENNQGGGWYSGGDDTAMNGLKLECCTP